jgi:hypothetical protein
MNFTRYMQEFYGPGGIYDYGFTASQINLATQLYKCRLYATGGEFCGDTTDRENVRDIILEAQGYEEALSVDREFV